MRIFLFAMLALPLGFGCGGGDEEKPDVYADVDSDADADADADAGDDALIGFWAGEVDQPGFGVYASELTIMGMEVGERAGTSYYNSDSWSCYGQLTYSGVSDGIHTLIEEFHSSRCVDSSLAVTLRDERTIRVEWSPFDSPYSGWLATGEYTLQD